MEENKSLNEEIKTEEKTEEVKPEVTNQGEIAPIDMKQVNIFEINTDIDTTNIEEEIETQRANLQATYKKQKRLGNIMTLIMVALVVVSMVMIVNKLDAVKYAGYAVGGVALVGMLLFWGLNRNKMPNVMHQYMKDVNDKFNAFLYKDQRFVKPSNNPEEKMDMALISADRVYSNIRGVGSRNVVHGTFLNKPFTVADVKAITLNGKNKEEDLFVGKYLTCENGLKFDGRIILNIRIKGEKVYDIPNDIADLEQVESKDEMTIWATPGLDYGKVITKDVLAKLNHLEIKEDKHLFNMNIVIWGGHTAVYLSYDNSIMAFPFEEEFKKAGLERFKADQSLIFDVFEILMKEKTVKTSASKAKKAAKVEEIKEQIEKVEPEKVEEKVEEKPQD